MAARNFSEKDLLRSIRNTEQTMEEKEYAKPVVIAEIGCNHMGDIEIAKKMIKTASQFCNAHAVKFQKRNPRECLSEQEYGLPHPNPANSYGNTYGEHREFLEFTIEQHAMLKSFCQEYGVVYSCSVWDMTSAREIIGLEPEFIKIPSACNTHFEMIDYICENYTGQIHVSLGMSTLEEEREIVEYFVEKNRNRDIVLYHCVSGYPVSFEDVCLLEIDRLRRSYGDSVRAIGFSGHHLGIAIDNAAYALGAQYIERHFTLDRTWKGTDHAASLEPDGLRRVVRDMSATYQSMRVKAKPVLDVEIAQRRKLKWDRNQLQLH